MLKTPKNKSAKYRNSAIIFAGFWGLFWCHAFFTKCIVFYSLNSNFHDLVNSLFIATGGASFVFGAIISPIPLIMSLISRYKGVSEGQLGVFLLALAVLLVSVTSFEQATREVTI
jgi:hypothetical protein